MKKVTLAVMIFALAGGALAATMNVQVQNGQLRASPSFLGQVVGTVAYGDRVEVTADQAGWSKVTAGGKTGWIHGSALTKKTIKLAAGGAAQTAASGDELALAGKGFNSDVESEFKAQNKDIDFTWVDKMGKWKVTPEEATEFLKDGGVAPAGGAK